MALAGKKDPLKKQKDSIPMKNAAIEKYLKTSKEHFPSFNQKKDTVVSTTSRDRNIAQSMNNLKAHAAQVGDTGGNAVSSSLIGTKETVTIKGNSFSNREYTFKRKVKKPKKSKK
jgi:hypothetical protein